MNDNPQTKSTPSDATNTTADFTIFEQHGTDCKTENVSSTIDNCDYCKRLVDGIKFYISLNCIDNVSDQNILLNFCQNTYSDLLNDFIHFTDHHSDIVDKIKLELINDHHFNVCHENGCISSRRYYNRRSQINNREINNRQKNIDSMLAFYTDIFDSIHYYIFHAFDTNATDEAINSNTHKFMIQTIPKHQQNDTEITFMDRMHQEIAVLTQFLETEEYDTVSVQQDVNEGYGNIYNQIMDKNDMKTIESVLQNHISSTVAFSTGLMFFYWPYYKDLQEDEEKVQIHKEEQLSTNINDFGGYSMSELYIEPYHESLKDEIFATGYVPYDLWKDNVIIKTDNYFGTKKVKSMKCWFIDDLHYEMKENDPITKEHLYAVILYCDFTELCTSFGATFRAVTADETLQSIKQRNRKYWWLSKTLRETVQYFGIDGKGKWDGTEGKWKGKENGPFFCGMSCVMHIPSFAIRLNAPTSTTKKFQISVNFATHDGIIIQLQNTGAWSSLQRFFNCSWISNFKQEDERLFFGGEHRVRIQSIRIVSTNQNYQIFFRAFYIFDCMVSGVDIDENDKMKVKATDIEIISKCIQWKLFNKQSGFDDYVNNTFSLFCKEKSQVILNLYLLDQYYDQKFVDLIMNTVSMDDDDDDDDESEDDNDCDDDNGNDDDDEVDDKNRNLIKQEIFEIFPDLQEMIIYCDDYSFSLELFVAMIMKSKSWKTIMLRAAQDEDRNNGRTWICSQYELLGTTKLNIELSQHQGDDYLIINRE